MKCMNTKRRPRLMCLEDRIAPAIFIVTNNFNNGAGSLRQAIIDANGMAGWDTIYFKAGLPSPITLTTGELAINQALTITGPGADKLTVSGNNMSRIFNTSGTAAGVLIQISGLTLTGGNAATNGGAILANDETLSVSNCVINNNTAGDAGGGISSDWNLTVVSSTISNNTASTSKGGGIHHVNGTLTLNLSSIVGNTAAGPGGGIYTFSEASLAIDNCAITGNETSATGGGIYAHGSYDGSLSIDNSTISGNSADKSGGGLRTWWLSSLTIRVSTIAYNNSVLDGGGISCVGDAYVPYLVGIIVAKNSAPSGPDLYASSTTFNSEQSFIGNPAGATIGGVYSTGDPMLAPLANNGGSTQTHALLPGSPCIDDLNVLLPLMTDQRGFGFVRTHGPFIDIGAYEVQSDFHVTNLNDSGDGSLRQAVLNANANPGDDSISFTWLFLPDNGTIALTSGEIAITSVVTINGGTIESYSVSGSDVSRIFNTSGAPAASLIQIANLTFIDGKASSSGGAILGGNENIALIDCKFIGNSNTSGNGGAVAMTSAGSLTAIDCEFTGNTATSRGGAISVLGFAATTIIQGCSISGNTGTGAGAIFAQNYLRIEDSTLSGNQATSGQGGATYVNGYGGTGTMILRNSTISGNTSTSNGGGIALVNFSGTLTVHNSTIVENNATAPLTNGGGISRVSGTGAISIESSVVSGNTCTTGPDIFSGGTVNVKTSAMSSNAGFIRTDLGGNLPFQPHANLKLGPLAFNGGPRQTHALQSMSPLLNVGSNPDGLTNDGRGTGFVRESGPIDIGVFEDQHSFVVTTLSDFDSPAGSLRQILADTEANPGPDTITFDSVLFATAKTIKVLSDEFVIASAVSIVGPGAALLTLEGLGGSRIINTQSAPASTVINISGITFAKGNASGSGGAILAGNEQLMMTACDFIDNKSSNDGGAIAITSASLTTFINCRFEDNLAADFGGAISVVGVGAKTTLQGCRLVNNTAKSAGAILALNELIIESSTLSGNQATGGPGGGAYVNAYLGVGSMTVRNSTISGNTSTANGGGIALASFNGTLTIQNSTITNNSATAPLTNGGGICRISGTGSIAIESSIVSGNSCTTGPDIFSGGTVTSKTSAIGSSGGFTRTDLGDNLPFQPHANLKLGSLADNGGPTQTHKPLAGSPLLNVGSNPASLSADQRGVTRVFDIGIDIGSVEVVTKLIVTNDNDAGPGSLRQNVNDANFDGGSNSITFDPVFFAMPRTIKLMTGELLISDSVTIDGPGLGLVTVSGNNTSRVFHVDGPGLATVVINDMTITGGLAKRGAGIYSEGHNLVIDNCIITANSAYDWAGIALQHPGFLELTNSHVTNNVATDVSVGGVGAAGGAKIVSSTISGNSAFALAGGLYANFGLTLINSTISNNSSGSDGGGLFLNGNVPCVITNSTISGNSSNEDAGGIWFFLSAPITISNSTITNNKATGGVGGGVFRAGGGNIAVVLESSIVYGNSGSTGGPDIYTTDKVDAKSSLIGTLSGITTFNGDAFSTANVGKSPLLGPLANNGGSTQTHAIMAGSPAIDNGSNSLMLANDQRGKGYARSFGAGPDIGAFEILPAPAKVNSIEINQGDSQRSLVTAIEITFSESVVLSPGAFILERTNGGPAGTIGVVPSQVGSVVTLAFNNTGTISLDPGQSLPDGVYKLTIVATNVTGFVATLDGDADGIAEGSPIDNHITTLHRLFGDEDGDAAVTSDDFAEFRRTFGTNINLAFDFNNNGTIDSDDFAAFRRRFGISFVP